MATKLIRTDKNGTQYYESSDCPRCGGTGFIQYYGHVEGGVCFKCQGSGFSGIRHWKVYTPEHAAELEQRKEDRFHMRLPEFYKNLGLTEDGRCYMVMANTWNRKDEIKAEGGRWNGTWWYLDHPSEEWDTIEVDAKEYLSEFVGSNKVEWCKDWERKTLIDGIRSKRRAAANASVVSEFFGEPGQRFDAEVTLARWFSFDWDGETLYGYKFTDDTNHHFVWVTSSDPWHMFGANDEDYGNRDWANGKVGQKLSIRATVKGHQERDGIKETKVNRCKFTIKEA